MKPERNAEMNIKLVNEETNIALHYKKPYSAAFYVGSLVRDILKSQCNELFLVVPLSLFLSMQVQL